MKVPHHITCMQHAAMISITLYNNEVIILRLSEIAVNLSNENCSSNLTKACSRSNKHHSAAAAASLPSTVHFVVSQGNKIKYLTSNNFTAHENSPTLVLHRMQPPGITSASIPMHRLPRYVYKYTFILFTNSDFLGDTNRPLFTFPIVAVCVRNAVFPGLMDTHTQYSRTNNIYIYIVYRYTDVTFFLFVEITEKVIKIFTIGDGIWECKWN